MTGKTKTCVLVCEDAMFVGMMLQDRLEACGYRVLMASRVEWHGAQMLQKPYDTKTVTAAIEARLVA